MAIFFNQNVKCTVNAVDLSDHVKSATLNYKFDAIEVTSMGQLAHAYIAGLQSGDVTITFNNDTATGSVLQTLNGLVGTSTVVVLQQDKTAAVSATNPKYTFTCFVDTVTPIAGDVGALAEQSVNWQISAASGTGAGVVVATA